MKSESTKSESTPTTPSGEQVGSTALFALFGGEAYYPGGGWYDFKGAFASPDDAKKATKDEWSFWHIINLQTQDVVEYHGGTCYCDGCPPDESLS